LQQTDGEDDRAEERDGESAMPRTEPADERIKT
jgi:hypothetical protein